MTSSKRQLFDLKDQTDLEHRFYIDPNHDLLHEKKHSKTKVPFGSNCDRFSSNTANENVPQLDNTLATSERLVKMIEKRLKKQIK